MPTLRYAIMTAYEPDHPFTVETRNAIERTLDANTNVIDWKQLFDAPNDITGEMPDASVLLCEDCIDAYRNGIEPGETNCEDRAARRRAGEDA